MITALVAVLFLILGHFGGYLRGRASGELERDGAYHDGWRDGRTSGFLEALWKSQLLRGREMRARVYEMSGDALAGRCIHGTPKDDVCPPCRAGFQ